MNVFALKGLDLKPLNQITFSQEQLFKKYFQTRTFLETWEEILARGLTIVRLTTQVSKRRPNIAPQFTVGYYGRLKIG